MEILQCEISIGFLTFNWVNSIEVESSWQLLTDNATIVLPANIKIDKHKLSEELKTGQKVTIKTGYKERLNTIYTGYVTYVKPSVPIEITCEDEMWKLKQSTINESGKVKDLKAFMEKFYSEYKTDGLNISIGKYYYDNKNKAKVLEELKSDFGLYAFFRNEILIVGKQYSSMSSSRVKFKLNYNIIEDELEFKRQDQIKLKVKAISNNSDGTKIEIELGDADGESRTLNFYDLDKTELKEHAQREMERLKYDGWRGSFTAFGEPFVKHGDKVELEHAEESDKKGTYYVDKVVYTFGTDGYRQEITLGAKV